MCVFVFIIINGMSHEPGLMCGLQFAALKIPLNAYKYLSLVMSVPLLCNYLNRNLYHATLLSFLFMVPDNM